MSEDVAPVGALCSYAYYRTRRESLQFFAASERCSMVMADSGAFTALHTGRKIDYEGYNEWLLENEDVIDMAACFDVIGDWEATNANYLAQLDANIPHIIPVFHSGSPRKAWDQILETAPRIVALGNMASTMSTQVDTEVIRIHQWAQEAGVGLHAFGLTKDIALSLPWFSADSSSWQASIRYGMQPIWNDTMNHKHIVSQGKPRHILKHRRLLESHGIDVMGMAKRELPWHHYVQPARRTYERAQRYYRQHNTLAPIPGFPPPLNILLAGDYRTLTAAFGRKIEPKQE